MDPPPYRLDPFVLDSTSNLLASLDLVGRGRRGENMDSMETDLVLEVPDTPDRVSVLHGEENACEEAGRKTYYHQRGDLSIRGRGANTSNAIDNENLFRRARLASLISKSFDAELSPQNRRTRGGQEQNSFGSSSSSHGEDRNGTREKVIDVSERIPFGISYPTRCRNDRNKKGKSLSGESETDFNIDLNSMGSSPSGLVRRRDSGIENSLEQSGGHCEAAGMGAVAGATVGSKYNSEGSEITGDLQPKTGQALSKPLQFNACPRNGERRRLVRNGCISPYNIAKNKSPLVVGDTSSSHGGTSACSKGKGINTPNDSQDQSEQVVLDSSQFDIPWRNTGQRRLVHNGCISPSNIARNNNYANGKKDGFDKLDMGGVSDGISSSLLHIVSPDSEFRQSDRMKGKECLNETVQTISQDAKHKSSSSREFLLSGKEATMIKEENGRPTEEMGWRTTRNRTGKLWTASVSRRKDYSGHSSDQHLESVIEDKEYVNVADNSPEIDFYEETIPSSFSYKANWRQVRGSSDVTFEQDPEGRRQQGAHKLTRGKRKSRSSRTNFGECSSSASEEVSFLQSTGEPSHVKSTRTDGNLQWRGITLGSIIDVDELPSSGLRCSNSHAESGVASEDSSVKAQQVESDEMLARQLQEQFFNESPIFGGAEEIDASLAWTLQQEEDVHRSSSMGARGQLLSTYGHYPRQPSRNSSLRSTNHSRMTSSARMTQLRRNIRRDMDLETRLNFLEAMEAAFDNSNDPIFLNTILQAQRDFNENDYEMLLALDDDNHQHVGASVHQINSLPQSVVQTNNFEEACAICLETPSVGDTIRHLPCLHKFHKECIDTWLARRTTCPICKSGIT